MAKSEALKAKEVIARLRVLNGQSFAILTEVNDVPGGTGRWADAVGMCLWQSRGIELHGYEVKVSRSDWLRELKNPEKADAVCKYCDRWWIVCGLAGIVKPEELPETWGLMEPHGTTLRTVTKAPKLDPIAIDRKFLASIFRRAAEQSADVDAIKAATSEGYKRGYRDGERDEQSRQSRNEDILLRKAVDDFEVASGVKITHYGGKHYGDAFAAVLRGEHRRDAEGLKRIQEFCHDTIKEIEKIKANPAIVG